MNELKLIISEQAIHDLTEIWLYIANDSPQAADTFIESIYEHCHLLCSSPDMGRMREELLPGLRSFPLKRYIIFYRVVPDCLEVIRVLSGYRDMESLF